MIHARDAVGCPGIHKLSLAKAIDIRKEYKTKTITKKKLAEKYNVNLSSIKDILNNKYYEQ